MKPSRRTFKTGCLDLSRGHEIAMSAEKSSETKRRLPFVVNLFAEAFGFPITSATKMESPKVVDDFSNFLRKRYDSDYVRNIRSGLYFIIDHSPIVEDLSYISQGWEEALAKAIPTLNPKSQSLIYWGQFVESKRIWPITPQEHDVLAAFQTWLTSDKGLSKHSTAFDRRSDIRDWLRVASLLIEHEEPEVQYSQKLKTQFDQISLYAKNEHIPPEYRRGLKRKRHGANTKTISDDTLKKLRYQLNAWIKWKMVKGHDVSALDIEHLLSPSFLEDYLDDKNKSQEITLETARTSIWNAQTLARLATGAGISVIKSESYDDALEELEKAVLDETWKPSRNDRLHQLSKSGKAPTMKGLHDYFVEKVTESLPKWSATLKELKLTPQPQDVSSIAVSTLEELRGAVFIGLEMYMSPRVGDCPKLPAECLRRLEEFHHISWIPQKTKRQNFSPEVDVCIPWWLTGLIDDYLLVRTFIHPTSPALFPPFFNAQNRSAVSDRENFKSKISYGQFQSLAKAWCGQYLGNNMMRKIVGKTYKSLGLTDLHMTFGHSNSSKEARMTDNNTEIERDHYMIPDDDCRLEIARRNFNILARKLNVTKNLDLSFLDRGTREILRANK